MLFPNYNFSSPSPEKNPLRKIETRTNRHQPIRTNTDNQYKSIKNERKKKDKTSLISTTHKHTEKKDRKQTPKVQEEEEEEESML